MAIINNTEEGKLFNVNGMRRELFKLFYQRREYVLNEQADAVEALQTILKLIHTQCLEKDERIDKNQFDDVMDLKCRDCIIH